MKNFKKCEKLLLVSESLERKWSKFKEKLYNELLKEIAVPYDSVRIPRKDVFFITKTVCSFYKQNIAFVFIKSRKKELRETRQIIQALTSFNTKLSLSKIGACTGDYNHATVLHSKKVFKNMFDTDPIFRANILELCTNFNLKYK